MVRVCISVEGPTEERFVQQLLVPYYSKKNIFIFPTSIGGNVSIPRIKSELEKLVYSFDFVTTFYDFYGFQKKAPSDTKEKLEKSILESVNKDIRDKIIPHIQMYEFEGLLFSQPSSIANILGTEHQSWADDILDEFKNNPETINDSPQTAPSKRLLSKTSYKKTIDGPDIAKDIGLETIRKMCKGFNSWIESLEALTH